MHLFHKWGKWKVYTADMVHVSRHAGSGVVLQERPFDQTRQRRECQLCGLSQDRVLVKGQS